jgi:CRISP-associated protein Cas1
MLKRTLFFSNPASLKLKNRQLVFLPEHGEERTIPVEDIGFVVIENQQVMLTMPLLNALVANNAAVVLCNDKHLPASMLLNLDSHSVQTEIFSHQIAASEPLKKALWQQTIIAKIRNQEAMLVRLGLDPGRLSQLAGDVKSGDTTNRESLAARIYWNKLFGDGFIRDRYGSSPNMMLNYGYTLLRAAVARGLSGSGLLPALGIHHHNRYNSYCLADDIMEPYRPFVDLYVYNIFNNKPAIEELGKEEKVQLLNVLSSDVKISGMMRPLMIAVSMTTASLARCFAKETRKVTYPSFS